MPGRVSVSVCRGGFQGWEAEGRAGPCLGAYRMAEAGSAIKQEKCCLEESACTEATVSAALAAQSCPSRERWRPQTALVW